MSVPGHVEEKLWRNTDVSSKQCAQCLRSWLLSITHQTTEKEPFTKTRPCQLSGTHTNTLQCPNHAQWCASFIHAILKWMSLPTKNDLCMYEFCHNSKKITLISPISLRKSREVFCKLCCKRQIEVVRDCKEENSRVRG